MTESILCGCGKRFYIDEYSSHIKKCKVHSKYKGPDCNGTGTKPEPEQEERIDNYKEVLKLVNWFTAHLMSQYAKVDAVNKEHIDKLYLEFNKRWKDIIISRNAEIEVAYEKGKQFVENAYRSEWEVQEDEIKRLKYQLEGFKDQYNINGKLTEEIEALKAGIELMRSQIKTVRQILTGVKSNMWEETINEAVRQLDKETK